MKQIADNGGIKLAYVAYQEWKAQGGQDPELAGFTPDQLFFVSYAQSWCTKATPEYLEQQVRTDPHSPPKFRVNGPLMNTPFFAEAFQCAEGTPMNPTDRCVVW